MNSVRLRSYFAAAAAAAAVLLSSGCREKVPLKLRTDPAPLARRLQIPIDGAVRWVAQSPMHDTGGVPGRTDFYVLYAYIELSDRAWQGIRQTAGVSGSVDRIVLPHDVASLIIPPEAAGQFKSSDGGFEADGPSFKGDSLTSDSKTNIRKAVRVGKALVVQMETD
jgi:hypothetical protein